MRNCLIVLVCCSSLASAQSIYSWVGADGVEHFTDDRSTIPHGAKVRMTEGDRISELAMPPAPADAGVRPVAPAAGPTEKSEELRWRDLFRNARERLAGLEDLVDIDRKKVEETGGLQVTARYACAPWYGVPLIPGPNISVTVGPGGATAGAPIVYAPPQCVAAYDPIWESIRERLALNRKSLERARADLLDLERRAAFDGVPNEWRR